MSKYTNTKIQQRQNKVGPKILIGQNTKRWNTKQWNEMQQNTNAMEY